MTLEEGQMDMLAALEQVATNANPDFMTEGWQAILTVRARNLPFTTEDCKQLVTASTHEPRAWGPLMRRAAMEGLIVKTGRYVKARNRTCHARDLAEWISTDAVRKAA